MLCVCHRIMWNICIASISMVTNSSYLHYNIELHENESWYEMETNCKLAHLKYANVSFDHFNSNESNTYRK